MADQLQSPEVNPDIQRMIAALTPEYLRGNTNVVDPNAQPGKIPAVEPMNFAPFLTADLVGNAAGVGAKAAAPLAGKLSPYAAALALMPREVNSTGPIKAFDILNEVGKRVGETTITQRSPKDLWVEWIGSGKGYKGEKNALGAKELRSLLPELKKQYPVAERVGGWRGTGARAGMRAKVPEGADPNTFPMNGAEVWQNLPPGELEQLLARSREIYQKARPLDALGWDKAEGRRVLQEHLPELQKIRDRRRELDIGYEWPPK